MIKRYFKPISNIAEVKTSATNELTGNEVSCSTEKGMVSDAQKAIEESSIEIEEYGKHANEDISPRISQEREDCHFSNLLRFTPEVGSSENNEASCGKATEMELDVPNDNQQGPIEIDENFNDANDDMLLQVNRKRTHRTFRATWLNDPLLENWVKENKSLDQIVYPVLCSICDLKLKVKSGKSDLITHAKSHSHISKASSILIQPKISTQFHDTSKLKHNVMKAELQIAALAAEHNLSFNLSEHLTPMIKNACNDSKIAKNLNCGRTKTGCLVKNVLGLQQFEQVCDLLKQHKFSLCIDESTDVSTTKNLSLLVRISQNYKVHDLFFNLIEVVNADAFTLHSEIVNVFNQNNINYKENLIGFAADGANNMTGKNNSVAALLSKDCSNLIVFKCICHSFALCSSYACMKLPSAVETLTRDIYNYVQNSPKRSAHLKEIIILLEEKPKKLLHPSQTRWLSLESVVNRILTLYEPLKIYFGFAAQTDMIDTAQSVLLKLKDPVNELYLKFLKYILPKVNELNKLFQSENPQVHVMYEEIKRLVLTIFDNFLKPQYIKSREIELIDFKHPHNLIEDSKLYLGVDVQRLISTSNINANDLKVFRNNCLAFYIELCEQITKRFNFKNNILKYIAMIDPQKIINKEINSLYDLFEKFPNLIRDENLQLIDSEFREIRNLDFKNIFGNPTNLIDLEVFWSTIAQIKREDKSLAFPLMGKFIFQILSLPNSSACVERTFSQINLNKTKTRTRLNINSLNGILLTKDYLKHSGRSCFDLQINKDLIKKFNYNNLYNNFEAKKQQD